MNRCLRFTRGPMAVCSILTALAFCSADVRANEELEELTLEQLLNVNLNSMEALGFHHTHPAGEWMVGYRFMTMRMNGNLDGTTSVEPEEVLQRYMVSPTQMTMDMHMFEVMYGLNDRVTFMGMFHYLRGSMDHQTRMQTSFTTDAQGLGDTSLSAMITLYQDLVHQVHVSAGVWLPTGSTDVRGDTPAGNDSKLPYPMQLGSGTVDFSPGIAYVAQKSLWAWGLQADGVVRTGENPSGYRLGNRYSFDGWAGYKMTDWVSSYVRFGGLFWNDIDGADIELNPRMVPTADPTLRGGKQLTFAFGFNFFQNSGSLAGHRLTLDAGFPRQSLNGPQLGNDWQVSFGWQKTF